MKKIFFTLLLVLFAVNVWGAIYYVSSSTGADTNNGTSSGTPFAHHPWDANATDTALATAIAAGSTVYMRKGDTWYDCYLNPDNNGTSGNNIVTTSIDTFGSGDLPVLSGSYNPSTFTWTDDGGGVFHATATTQPKIVVWNGTMLTLDTDTTPTANKWYWTANVLYVNVGANPSTGTLLAGKRDYIVFSTGGQDYHTFSNLTLQVANSIVINASGNLNYSITNNIIRWWLTRGVSVYQGGVATITGNSIYNQSGNYSTFGVQGILLREANNSVVTNNNINQINDTGLHVWDSTGVTISGNTVHHCWNGGYYGGTGAGSGIKFTNGAAPNTITKNTVYNNYLGIYQTVSTGNGGNSITNNVVYDNIVNGIDSQIDPGINPTLIYNNTVRVNPSASNTPAYRGHAIAVQLTSKKAKIANNNIYVAGSSSETHGIFIYDASGTTLTDVQIDNNNIYVPNGARYGALGTTTPYTTYTSLAAWQTAAQGNSIINNKIHGLDGLQASAESHSISIDPKFKASANFHTKNTALKAAGVDVSLLSDFDGKLYNGKFPIGAFIPSLTVGGSSFQNFNFNLIP